MGVHMTWFQVLMSKLDLFFPMFIGWNVFNLLKVQFFLFHYKLENILIPVISSFIQVSLLISPPLRVTYAWSLKM